MQEEVNQKVISLSIQGSQDHCQCAKSSPSEVPGNGQPQETESNAGENGRKRPDGLRRKEGKSPKKRLKRKSHMEDRPSSS